MSEIWYYNKKQLIIIETSDFHILLHLSSFITLLYELKLSVKFGYLGNLGNFLLQVYEDNWLSKLSGHNEKLFSLL